MPLPTIGASLHLQRTTAQGPQHPLGTEVLIGGSTLAQTLAYISASPDFDLQGGPQYGPHAASTDIEVTIPANTGEQVWIYVYNDSGTDIERGEVVAMKAATAAKHVRQAPVDTQASRVVGVAQWTLPTGYYGWILKKGMGEVLAGTGTIDVDEPICVDDTDAATARESAGATDPAESFGWSTENAVAAALATCWIDCRG